MAFYADLHVHSKYSRATSRNCDLSLDRFRLVSNSDAHSPEKLGREVCVFDTDLDYFALRRALETGEGYGGTLEFFPELCQEPGYVKEFLDFIVRARSLVRTCLHNASSILRSIRLRTTIVESKPPSWRPVFP